jgi:hypothetical protein
VSVTQCAVSEETWCWLPKESKHSKFRKGAIYTEQMWTMLGKVVC